MPGYEGLGPVRHIPTGRIGYADGPCHCARLGPPSDDGHDTKEGETVVFFDDWAYDEVCKTADLERVD